MARSNPRSTSCETAIFTSAGSPKSESDRTGAPGASKAPRIFSSSESIPSFSPSLSVFLCVLCVKALPFLKNAKALTQRTRGSTEKTGDAWARFGILEEILLRTKPAVRLVLRLGAWYIGMEEDCGIGDSWL